MADTEARRLPEQGSEDDFLDHQTGAFYRTVDWISFWVTFILTFGAYIYTLAPTVTLEDSGELAVAADYLGVPHPPGYPIWTVLSWLFQWVFEWKTYFGQPNPAWAVGLQSAFFGALACGLTAILVSRSGADMLRHAHNPPKGLDDRTENILCFAAGVTGGLLLAFTPVLWSQSVIVEVYSLNAFFMALILVLLYQWMCRPQQNSILYAMWFAMGLGLTNHQSLYFIVPALLFAMVRDLRLLRDASFILGGVLIINSLVEANTATAKFLDAGVVLFYRTSLLLNTIPAALGILVAICLFIVFGVTIVTTKQFMTEWKRVVLFGLMTVLGVTFNVYMPVASDQNPPMNWGYPRTEEGFKHALTRGQYEKINPVDNFKNNVLKDFGATYRAQVHEVILNRKGFISVVAQFTWQIAYLALLLFPFLFIARLRIQSLAWILSTFIAFLILTFGFIIFQNPKLDVQTLFIGRVQYIQAHAIWALWVSYGLLFFLAYVTSLMQKEPFLRFVGSFLLAGLLLVPLRLLINYASQAAGESAMLQDVAIWAGLLFVVTICVFLMSMAVGSFRFARWAGLFLMVALPLVLVFRNWYDDEFVKFAGGAEQNGHDFGWQFGNWQLRGASAILEEIPEEDRAGYPDPTFPPDMGTNAVFYGGTDPGRFVPTYMIFSAKVRPDVYLITQNALADNTYMSVMRDLYGDDIWIPSQVDSNLAFQQYVQDVQSGKIPPGADVQFKDGRVSVQGVQGVMMINGILARMIFERNKYKNDFYVEESYVIPWMYPYLEPHGLIMKINPEPMPQLTPEMVKKDRDFWKWYTDRLLSNEKFQRDVVARKTFSKLRSAIAGLYAYRRQWDDAITAFREAIDLYPLSPEANFRLADVYMQLRRFSEARELIENFLVEDPGNDKVEGFLNQIRNTENSDKRRLELEQVLAKGGDVFSALELADIYRRMNLRQQFEALTGHILGNPQIQPDICLKVAEMYQAYKRMDLYEAALKKFIEKQPANPKVWIDLAAAQLAQQKANEALQSLKKAISIGGEPVRDIARKDKRFDPIRQTREFAELVPAVAAGNMPLNLPPGF